MDREFARNSLRLFPAPVKVIPSPSLPIMIRFMNGLFDDVCYDIDTIIAL